MAQPDPNQGCQPATEFTIPTVIIRRRLSGCNGLPPELVSLICKFPSLSKRDLKSLRLTSKIWRDAAAKYLFKTIAIYPFETVEMLITSLTQSRHYLEQGFNYIRNEAPIEEPLRIESSTHRYQSISTETFLDFNGLSRIAKHISTLKLLGKNTVGRKHTLGDFGYPYTSRNVNRHVRNLHQYAPYPLPSSFGPQKLFSSLKSLKLFDVDIGRDRLQEFLLAHSDKLQELELTNVYVTEIPWKAIIMGMAQHMKLKKVTFDGMLVQRCYPKTWETKEVWYFSTSMPYCQSGKSHEECIKSHIENYAVNGGDWITRMRRPRDKKYTKGDLCQGCGVEHMRYICGMVDGGDYDRSWSPHPGLWNPKFPGSEARQPSQQRWHRA